VALAGTALASLKSDVNGTNWAQLVPTHSAAADTGCGSCIGRLDTLENQISGMSKRLLEGARSSSAEVPSFLTTPLRPLHSCSLGVGPGFGEDCTGRCIDVPRPRAGPPWALPSFRALSGH
jgi:hypothetical protein